MSTMTPIEAHEKIAHFANNHRMPEVRMVKDLAVGEWVRQGDVNILRIEKIGKSWKKNGNRQLAPGTSPGSRHIVTVGPTLFVSLDINPTDRSRGPVRLLGPQIEAKERFEVEHPEHAHISLPPGNYQVSYQLDFQRQQAVCD